MRTKFKYIHFVEQPDEPNIWDCRNTKHGDDLGVVFYYHPWKIFGFIPEGRPVFSADCLRDIAEFMEQLKE